MSKMTFSEKMSLAVGGASLAVAPTIADAALVTVTPTPGSLKISVTDADGTAVNWDVDGTGLPEFELRVQKTVSSGPNFQVQDSFLFINSQNGTGAQLNGRGFVGLDTLSDKGRVLNSSFDVGQTLASPYVFGLSNASDRRIVRKTFFQSSYGAPVTSSGVFIDDINLSAGANFVGFRFDAGSGLQYGWAEILLDLTTDAESLEISGWTYNDVPGDAAHVGTEAAPPIPLPPSILPALTVLGLGAAGVRAMRKRRGETKAAA